MMRQYHAQRRRGGDNPKGVGVISTGSIYYLQDDGYWRERVRGRPVCRNPWIVRAFLNGTMGAGRRNAESGMWESVYVSRRSDMALVQSLRDGRIRKLPVRLLILHDDLGLWKQPTEYPSLPRRARADVSRQQLAAASNPPKTADVNETASAYAHPVRCGGEALPPVLDS